MSLYSDMSTQTLYYRKRQDEDYWNGQAYEPPMDEDPTPFACVYEPHYFDRGRDYAATGNGRVITETEFATGDRIITALATEGADEVGQDVTQVDTEFDFDGSLYGYVVYL